MKAEEQICLVSGATGYVGGRVAAGLRGGGWQVRELTRSPKPGREAVPFQLGTEISASALQSAAALVHCAYDFRPLKWRHIHEANVGGTEKLLRAARDAGVKRVIYLSSMSAFEGCRSLYGRAKLEAEAIAQSFGAIIIRPGLIWSHSPGGIFGKLVGEVERARILPLFGNGTQIQYLIHDEDLTGFISECVSGRVSSASGPVTIANEQPWRFRQILEEIARAKGNRLWFIPIPWRLIWAGLKGAESIGVRLNFRSDSLVSLVNQNPNPSFAAQRTLGIQCRPFQFRPETN
jgi:nucleoside-diphosphate-sugar epimerase